MKNQCMRMKTWWDCLFISFFRCWCCCCNGHCSCYYIYYYLIRRYMPFGRKFINKFGWTVVHHNLSILWVCICSFFLPNFFSPHWFAFSNSSSHLYLHIFNKMYWEMADNLISHNSNLINFKCPLKKKKNIYCTQKRPTRTKNRHRYALLLWCDNGINYSFMTMSV